MTITINYNNWKTCLCKRGRRICKSYNRIADKINNAYNNFKE